MHVSELHLNAMVLGLEQNFYVFVLPLVLLEIGIYGYAFTAEWRTCQVTLGLLGLFWCFAALWVEIRLEQVHPGFNYLKPPEMKAYRPFCDFAPWAKCSKVLMSPPGSRDVLRCLLRPLDSVSMQDASCATLASPRRSRSLISWTSCGAGSMCPTRRWA